MVDGCCRVLRRDFRQRKGRYFRRGRSARREGNFVERRCEVERTARTSVQEPAATARYGRPPRLALPWRHFRHGPHRAAPVDLRGTSAASPSTALLHVGRMRALYSECCSTGCCSAAMENVLCHDSRKCAADNRRLLNNMRCVQLQLLKTAMASATNANQINRIPGQAAREQTAAAMRRHNGEVWGTRLMASTAELSCAAKSFLIQLNNMQTAPQSPDPALPLPASAAALPAFALSSARA